MKALLLATGTPGRAACWRRTQLAALLAGLGAEVDLVLIAGDRLVPLPPRIARFAVTRAAGPGDVARGLRPDGYDLAIAASGCAPDRDCARVWLADRWSEDGADGGIAGADLVLAPLEYMRAGLGRAGAEALRLPLPPRTRTARAGPGPMAGWCGPWPGDLSAGMAGVLDHLARRPVPEPPLLIAGTTDVAIPRRLAPVTARGDGGSLALGLGVLPTDHAAPVLDGVVELLARGCPIATTPAFAAAFEDRWHLPTADSPAGIAALIADWHARPRALATGAEATLAAFRDDHARMTAHVGATIATRLAG